TRSEQPRGDPERKCSSTYRSGHDDLQNFRTGSMMGEEVEGFEARSMTTIRAGNVDGRASRFKRDPTSFDAALTRWDSTHRPRRAQRLTKQRTGPAPAARPRRRQDSQVQGLGAKGTLSHQQGRSR